MSKLFNQIQFNRVKKAKFDLSHERKMSMKMGTLTPMFVQEVLPGDSFRVNTEMLMRLQPLVAPIMHRLQVKTDFFFVPNRLVYDGWQNFITGGEDGASTEIPPYITLQGLNSPQYDPYVTKGTLWDYLGLPTIDNLAALTQELKISAIPFRAYNLIWNEYYRDQNLQAKVVINKSGGAEPNQSAIMNLKNRAWEKDYFTSCLPFAQKGNPVNVPIDPILKDPAEATGYTSSGSLSINAGGQVLANSVPVGLDTIEEMGLTVNDLRKAVRLQEWMEKNARAGSRYIESILAHFGVLGKDARLQRPEYLGGGMNPIVVSEVLSTYQAPDDTGYPQGTMKGHGISTGSMMGFKRKFDEHGFIIGVCTVIPKTAYQQGLPKEFSRFDKLDYAWPSFAQLGEQEVKLKELWLDPATFNPNNEETFGYQSRYAEYKYKASTVHGDFKTTLDFWHMGRIFTAKPTLNNQFITADPTKRVFAVETQDEDEILCQLYNRVDAIRPLPYFNSPTL